MGTEEMSDSSGYPVFTNYALFDIKNSYKLQIFCGQELMRSYL